MPDKDLSYVMVTGRVALEGESATLRDDERVQRAYLGGDVGEGHK